MDARELESALRSNLKSQFENITVLELIDSTNAEAIRRMHALQETSQLIVALSQSAGRGRRGRKWMSPPGAGVYVSITRGFDQPLAGLQGLSLLTALGVAEAVQSLGIKKVQLKWPNDVLVGHKKLAGILLETCHNGTRPVIVFGIGINIDLPDEVVAELDRPITDIRRELIQQRKTDTADLLIGVCKSIESKLDQFLKSGFAQFRDQWNALDAYLQEDVVIINGDQQIRGVYEGVDDSASLLLNDEQSGMRTISGGEVFPSLRAAKEFDAGVNSAGLGSSEDSA